MSVVRKSSGKDSTPRIVSEKKVFFLGKWKATQDDIEHLRSQTKEWILEIPSKGGHKCKLRVTTKGIRYSVERHNFFYGKKKTQDRIPLGDIKRFSIDGHYLHVIIAIVQISENKFHVLVFRCKTDIDCKELVDSYNVLSQYSRDASMPFDARFGLSWREDRSDMSGVHPEFSATTLPLRSTMHSKSNGDLPSMSQHGQRMDIYSDFNRGHSNGNVTSEKQAKAFKGQTGSVDYIRYTHDEDQMFAKPDRKKSKSLEILDAYDESRYETHRLEKRRNSEDLHKESREVLDHLDSVIDESSHSHVDLPDDQRWVRDVGCQVEVDGAPLGPGNVQVETSTYIDPNHNVESLSREFHMLEARAEAELGSTMSRHQTQHREMDIPISHLDNRPPAPLPSNGVRSSTMTRNYHRSSTDSSGPNHQGHITENAGFSSNPSVRLVNVSGGGGATLDGHRGHYENSYSHQASTGRSYSASSPYSQQHGASARRYSSGHEYDGHGGEYGRGGIQRSTSQTVTGRSGGMDEVDYGRNHLVYGINSGGPPNVHRAESMHVLSSGGRGPMIVETAPSEEWSDRHSSHVNFDERTIQRPRRGTVERRIEDVYGHGRYVDGGHLGVNGGPPPGGAYYMNGDINRGQAVYEGGRGVYTVDRRHRKKDKPIFVKRSESVNTGGRGRSYSYK